MLSKLKDKKINLGIRPEHLMQCKEKDAIVSGKLDLVENLSSKEKTANAESRRGNIN